MKLSDFNYILPDDLIAANPENKRDLSRLAVVCRNHGLLSHTRFYNLPDFFKKNDLLVLNNTKVFSARLYGNKATGGKVELLFIEDLGNNNWLCMCKSSKALKEGAGIIIEGIECFKIIKSDSPPNYIVNYCGLGNVLDFLDKYGVVPLPPYIQKKLNHYDDDFHKQRYQTIYAKYSGSVAAPTAGLHFTNNIFKNLNKIGVNTTAVTLHVGPGTFLPVRTEDICNHKMHKESFSISSKTCDLIKTTKDKGGRIIAVGTTVVRTLESLMAKYNEILPVENDETDIFIYPGFKFKIIDGMITNFHLPGSTLIMLVAAFTGKDNILNSYKECILEKYRFYSYGDCMLIL